MARPWAMALAMLVAAAVSACPVEVGHAQSAAPQQGASCAEIPDGTLTGVGEGDALLQCRDGRWDPFTETYPSSDAWLTYGPELTLHGQARRNPEILAGNWVGLPQDPASQCRAVQSVVVVAGQLAPPQVLTGEPGQPLELALTTQLFSIELGGNCLWQKKS